MRSRLWCFSVLIQRPHHADAREHQPASADLSGMDQVLDCDLPARLLLNLMRQLHDVIGGVLQRDEL